MLCLHAYIGSVTISTCIINIFILVFVLEHKQKQIGNLAYAAQALPSAGTTVFLQSILCGGVPFCDGGDFEAKTMLGQVAMIIEEEPGINPDRLVEVGQYLNFRILKM